MKILTTCEERATGFDTRFKMSSFIVLFFVVDDEIVESKSFVELVDFVENEWVWEMNNGYCEYVW